MNGRRRPPALPANLAENLRDVRRRRRLTQAALARLCGLPRSTVAQVETGSGNPTPSVLAQLAGALQISIEELLSPPHASCQLFPKGSLPSARRGRDGLALVRRTLPDPIPGMEIDRMELQPGARMAGIPHRPGTREYLACETGRLTLWTAGDRFDLAAGDVAVGFSVVTLAPVAGMVLPDRPSGGGSG